MNGIGSKPNAVHLTRPPAPGFTAARGTRPAPETRGRRRGESDITPLTRVEWPAVTKVNGIAAKPV